MYWIPGQARNDELPGAYTVIYRLYPRLPSLQIFCGIVFIDSIIGG